MGVGRTFQNLGLFTNLDVVENLMLGRHHLHEGRVPQLDGAVVGSGPRATRSPTARRSRRSSSCSSSSRYRDRPVGLLPYGVQKRIELGRALAMEPKLLLLDEPVAGMNLEETEAMARYILEAQRRLGVAMILVEHDMHLVMDLADRVLALDFGMPIATGTPEEVGDNQAVIDAYLGRAS